MVGVPMAYKDKQRRFDRERKRQDRARLKEDAIQGVPQRNSSSGAPANRPPPFTLRPFQKRFLKHAFADGIDQAALSLPRGGGKSSFAAWIAHR